MHYKTLISICSTKNGNANVVVSLVFSLKMIKVGKDKRTIEHDVLEIS